ncbi:MAG TPA: sulfotransferase domain-containing protein [Chitinophagales bacterium]|nr:sulfotransferase domain-containing protein [Chitinophagales bacterium]
MNKVNTIIIGAGRSGTTSVFAWMEHHPDIQFSITKEVHYFSLIDLYQRGEKYFHSLFEGESKKIIATADTYLLMDHDAPARIKAYNPDMRIIVMLRDPIDRAYSNYQYSVQFGHERSDISFADTITLEQERLLSNDIAAKNNLCHCYGSLYARHLSVWTLSFPKEQIFIGTLDQLKSDADALYKRLSTYLGIQYHAFSQQGEAFNTSTGVKSKWLQQLLLNREHPLRKTLTFFIRPFRNLIIKSGIIDKIYKLNKTQVELPKLTIEERQIVTPYFEQDLKQLEADWHVTFQR